MLLYLIIKFSLIKPLCVAQYSADKYVALFPIYSIDKVKMREHTYIKSPAVLVVWHKVVYNEYSDTNVTSDKFIGA